MSAKLLDIISRREDVLKKLALLQREVDGLDKILFARFKEMLGALAGDVPPKGRVEDHMHGRPLQSLVRKTRL